MKNLKKIGIALILNDFLRQTALDNGNSHKIISISFNVKEQHLG